MNGRALPTASVFGGAIAAARLAAQVPASEPAEAERKTAARIGAPADAVDMPRRSAEKGASMLRMLRPDLLCGLGGFALGAAALLLGQGAIAGTAPAPVAHTDILAAAERPRGDAS